MLTGSLRSRSLSHERTAVSVRCARATLTGSASDVTLILVSRAANGGDPDTERCMCRATFSATMSLFKLLFTIISA